MKLLSVGIVQIRYHYILSNEIVTCFFYDIQEFEDSKGIIKIRKSKNRQHNGRKKKYKKTNNDLQNIQIKLKIE